jgi:hypothetical protein
MNNATIKRIFFIIIVISVIAGLDPQSPDNQCLFSMGWRVKPAMTGFSLIII